MGIGRINNNVERVPVIEWDRHSDGVDGAGADAADEVEVDAVLHSIRTKENVRLRGNNGSARRGNGAVAGDGIDDSVPKNAIMSREGGGSGSSINAKGTGFRDGGQIGHVGDDAHICLGVGIAADVEVRNGGGESRINDGWDRRRDGSGRRRRGDRRMNGKYC